MQETLGDEFLLKNATLAKRGASDDGLESSAIVAELSSAAVLPTEQFLSWTKASTSLKKDIRQ